MESGTSRKLSGWEKTTSIPLPYPVQTEKLRLVLKRHFSIMLCNFEISSIWVELQNFARQSSLSSVAFDTFLDKNLVQRWFFFRRREDAIQKESGGGVPNHKKGSCFFSEKKKVFVETWLLSSWRTRVTQKDRVGGSSPQPGPFPRMSLKGKI